MTVWRHYSVALGGPSSGTVLGELPLLGFSITDRLGGTGSLSSSVPIFHEAFVGNPSLLDAETTMVVSERDGVIQFAGPLIDGPQGSPGSATAGIGAAGGWQIVRDRAIRSTAGMTNASVVAGEARFDQVDQFEIVEDLIAHLNAIREDVQIEVSYPGGLSGVLRDRSYELDKGKSVGEAIEQLALVENGFEWAFIPTGTVDALTFRLVLSYPRLGRMTPYRFDLEAQPREATPIVLMDGDDVLMDGDDVLVAGMQADYRIVGSSNVIDAAVGVTSAQMVTRFTAIGPGEGPSQLVAHATDPNLLDRRRLIERSGSWTDVSVLDTLQGHAGYGLAIDSSAARSVKVIADPNADPRLGAVSLGDTVHSTINKGVEQFDGAARIVTREITATVDGEETVTYELAPVGRFA